MPALITVLAMAAVFCITAGVAYALNRGRIDEARRVDRLRGGRGRKRAVSLSFGKKKEQSSDVPTRRRLEKLADELYVAGLALRPEEFVLIWGAIAVILPAVMLFFGLNVTMCLGVVIVGAVAPIFFVKLKRRKRLAKFDKQLIDALGVICNSLRAGVSFQTAMNTISIEMEDPIAREFGRVYRECQMGMPMETSFNRMVARTGNRDLELICSAVIIQKQIGGNLAEVLENISSTISERVKLRGEIKTMTSSGSLSGYIIGALPIFMLVMLMFINPTYVNMFFETSTGRIMLIISAALEIVGFTVVKKIVNIKM